MTEIVLGAAAGYLLGSIPTGVIVARARGIDIREQGSGNIGATNVARTLGKKAGAMVLLIDALKGLLPVLAAVHLVADPWAHVATAAAAILGHVFPVWLRFRGGKGVATALGVFLGLSPIAAAIAVTVFLAVYVLFKIASVGSLLAGLALVGALWWQRAPLPYVYLGAAAWLLIVIRHQGNLRRLWRREELKV
jgi:acyl phosphate:glycerol-3-phosphate acyltransferase